MEWQASLSTMSKDSARSTRPLQCWLYWIGLRKPIGLGVMASSKLHSVKLRQLRSYANYVHSEAGDFHLGVIRDETSADKGVPDCIWSSWCVSEQGASFSKSPSFSLFSVLKKREHCDHSSLICSQCAGEREQNVLRAPKRVFLSIYLTFF